MSNDPAAESSYRRALEDLLRIRTIVERALDEPHEILIAPGRHGAWSIAEHAMHIVLSLDECAQAFRGCPAVTEGNESSTLGMTLSRKAAEWTFRYPGGLLAPTHLVPRSIPPKESIRQELRTTLDEVIRFAPEAKSRGGGANARHHLFGFMPFSSWARILLVHALHHRRLIREMR